MKMSNDVPVSKCDGFSPVPSRWRKTIHDIVEKFKNDDFSLNGSVPGVRPVSQSEAKRFSEYIEDYGDTLVSLPEETWDTAVCEWVKDFWDVTVDLYTANEGHSDMVLELRVRENGNSFVFEVRSVYVP
jgi:hypothetical protein